LAKEEHARFRNENDKTNNLSDASIVTIKKEHSKQIKNGPRILTAK